jgi:Flp pilus assembly protein TadG
MINGVNFMRRSQSGWRHFRRRTDGMTAVEFALLLPVMLLIVCGIMDFGNLYFQLHIVNEAAREGARIAATQKPPSYAYPTKSSIQTVLQTAYGPSVTVDTMTPNPITSGSSGSSVTVTIKSTVNILTPVINQLIPNNPAAVYGKCVMRVE